MMTISDCRLCSNKKLQVFSQCKETVRLQCAVPTSEKLTVQFSTLHFRRDGSLLANISGGKGQFPATVVGVERLEVSLFHMVLRY